MPGCSYRMLLNVFECNAHLATYIVMDGPCLVWRLELRVEEDIKRPASTSTSTGLGFISRKPLVYLSPARYQGGHMSYR